MAKRKVSLTTTKTAVAGVDNENKNGNKNASASTFSVESAGYKETFGTKQDALAQAEFLKKRAVKQNAPVNIKVVEISADGTKKTIHEIKIDEDFYN